LTQHRERPVCKAAAFIDASNKWISQIAGIGAINPEIAGIFEQKINRSSIK
jgi:hypothetical protein